ncbi:MAG: hypothetical protein KDK69_03105, partial [Chlamydiia bacterium]|nr:hypothetical protein [Chlamydiia bacterium]
LPRTSLLKSITTGKLLQSGVDMELVLESVIPWLFSRDFVSNPHQVAAKKEEMMKNPYPQSINGFIGQINALETFDSTSFLSSIPHPLLLLAGEEDLSTPPWCAKLLHNHLPHSTLHFFPRMGHMAHVEKRDEVIALINSFF